MLLGALYFFVPLLATFEFSLRYRRGVYSFEAYRIVLGDPRFQATFLYSTVLALATIVVGVLLIVPTAYWIQLRLPKLRPIVEFITLLPLVIPAIVLVFGYLRIYNSSSFLPMTANERATDLLLMFSYVTLAMPYMYRAVDAGLRAIDVRTLTEAAQSLGASWGTILLEGDPAQRAGGGAERRVPDVRHRDRRVHDGKPAGSPGVRPLPPADRRQPRVRAGGARDHHLRGHMGLHGPDPGFRPPRAGKTAGAHEETAWACWRSTACRRSSRSQPRSSTSSSTSSGASSCRSSGPVGCGKTTTLRMIAGFETPTAGAIRIDGVRRHPPRPNQRNVGMVFQSYALFPNMTVADNVAFGLKVAKPAAGDRAPGRRRCWS